MLFKKLYNIFLNFAVRFGRSLSFPEIENVPLAFGIVREAMALKQNNFCKQLSYTRSHLSQNTDSIENGKQVVPARVPVG